LPNRSEYLKRYYQRHKEAIATYYKKRYRKEKKKALTKARKYYRLNRDMILLKARLHNTSKQGHAQAIWKAVSRYAKKWRIPCAAWPEFKEWAMNDDGYEAVFQQWRDSGFDRTFSPVAMRGVKKNGFVPDNLRWDYREKYSWWSQELSAVLERDAKMEEARKVRNARDKEWRKKVRDQWKAKQKAREIK
jgi:hypothetical protein